MYDLSVTIYSSSYYSKTSAIYTPADGWLNRMAPLEDSTAARRA